MIFPNITPCNFFCGNRITCTCHWMFNTPAQTNKQNLLINTVLGWSTYVQNNITPKITLFLSKHHNDIHMNCRYDMQI